MLTNISHIVPISPIVISADPIQGAIAGSPQVIHCTVSTAIGVDPNIVMISWIGPDENSIVADNRVIISPTTYRDNNYTSSVQFTYLREDDEGLYTCNVTILETSVLDSIQLGNFSG